MNLQDYLYVEDDAALAQLVAQYREAKLLVLDTEFVRTRTYYACLGLIQAYDGKTLALIDPVAISDLSSFWALLTDEKITKLLHSCSEDLEVFARQGHCQPKPLFDSQLAAAIAGMGHGLGYAKLVQECLGVELDKGESRTDWLKRPLSKAQLSYAANDVYYLHQLYPQLLQKLQQQGRLEWALEESQRMTEGRLDVPDEDTAYLRVKNAFQLSTQQLAVLKVLAAWRLRKALAKDMALGFVMKDHALIGLAKRQPRGINDVLAMKELTDHEKRLYAKDVLKVMAKADMSNLPEPLDVLALKPGYKSAFKSIKQCLGEVAESDNVPMELLGSKRHIHEYLEWVWAGKQGQTPLVLLGWRGQLVADKLAKLTL